MMDFRQIIGNVRPHAVCKHHKPLRSCLIPEVFGKAISAAGENHPVPVNICFRPFLRSKQSCIHSKSRKKYGSR